MTEDAWHSLIEEWCNKPEPRKYENEDGDEETPRNPPKLFSISGRVLTTEILEHCLGKYKANFSPGDSQRVARVLKRMNWERGRNKESIGTGLRVRFFYRPNFQKSENDDPPF